MSGFQQIVEKILGDASFREALVTDPGTVLESEGIAPTPEILAAFAGVDAGTLQALAENFNENDAAR